MESIYTIFDIEVQIEAQVIIYTIVYLLSWRYLNNRKKVVWGGTIGGFSMWANGLWIFGYALILHSYLLWRSGVPVGW